MSQQDIINIIQSIGFPIVMCVIMGYFIYFMYNKNSEDMEEIRKAHAEETGQLRSAIENNTIALTKLVDLINSKKEV